MPNWCSTSYALRSDNKEELKFLYDLMKGLKDSEKPLVENGFGNTWLGCLVTALGEDWNDFSCRGDFNSLDYNGDEITFNTECAWYRCYEVDYLIRKRYPSIQIYFRAEEPGMCIYEKNDAEGLYFPENYVLDIMSDDIYYLDNAIKVMEFINKRYNKDFKTIEEVHECIRQYDASEDREEDNDCIILNEITLADL